MNGRIVVQASTSKNLKTHLKNKPKRAQSVATDLEHLLSKHKDLSSNPSAEKIRVHLL
jgi:hypothetical protein